MNRCLTAAAVLLVGTAASAQQAGGPPLLLKAENLPIAVEKATLQNQFDALSAMPSVAVEYSKLGPVSSVQGDTGVVLPERLRDLEVGDSANELLELFGPLLLATGRESLTVYRTSSGLPDRRDIRTEQFIRGRPVVNGNVLVGFEEGSGRVYGVWSNFLPDRGLPMEAKLSAEQAWQTILRALEASGDAVPNTARTSETPSLAYFGVMPDTDRPHLVWTMDAAFECPTGRRDHERVWVDAIDGMVVGRQSLISYIRSPGPCQLDEGLATAECKAEPIDSAAGQPFRTECNAGSRAPVLSVSRIDCSNRFRLSWHPTPGATTYHAIRAQPSLGWVFAQTVADGYVHQCTTELNVPYLIKVRPCNGCGCGDWSEPQLIDPSQPCP